MSEHSSYAVSLLIFKENCPRAFTPMLLIKKTLMHNKNIINIIHLLECETEMSLLLVLSDLSVASNITFRSKRAGRDMVPLSEATKTSLPCNYYHDFFLAVLF